MLTNLDVATVTPETYQAMCTFTAAAGQGLDAALAALVKLRVSQVNGCSYCVDLHAREARAAGVDEDRLLRLSAWRRTPVFGEREQHALALADAVTSAIANPPEPEEALHAASAAFEPAELAQLLWTIAAVNAWNRIASATALTLARAAAPS
jgi:AhpD family alkylhydroperoxidase